jgi:hypothetical protein
MVIRAAFLSVFFIVNLTGTQSALPSEVHVYRAVLSDRACSGLGRTAGRNALVIHPSAESLEEGWWLPGQGGDLERRIRDWFPQVTSDDVRRFLDANRRVRSLPSQILTAPGSTGADPSILQTLERDGTSWAEFYRHYSGATGPIRLGSVSVEPSAQHVLAYCGRQYASLGGEGYLFLLGRTSSGWAVLAKRLVWES